MGHVVTGLAFEHLRDGIAADRSFDGVLHIGDVDAVASRGFAVDDEVKVRLADDAKQAQVGDPFDVAHHVYDLLALGFERLEIGAVKA